MRTNYQFFLSSLSYVLNCSLYFFFFGSNYLASLHTFAGLSHEKFFYNLSLNKAMLGKKLVWKRIELSDFVPPCARLY